MKAMKRRGTWLLMAALVAGALSTGCGHNLFSDATSDTTRESKIDKYWGGDSAIKTTESRRKASETGFGYPSGPAQ